MDKSSLLRLYKKYLKQKHNKNTEEQIKSNIENLSPENQQIIFDLICISPCFKIEYLNQEESGYSFEWDKLPTEIKEVIQVYLEKLQ